MSVQQESQLSAAKVPSAAGRVDAQDEVRGLQERLVHTEREIAINRIDFNQSLSTAQ